MELDVLEVNRARNRCLGRNKAISLLHWFADVNDLVRIGGEKTCEGKVKKHFQIVDGVPIKI